MAVSGGMINNLTAVSYNKIPFRLPTGTLVITLRTMHLELNRFCLVHPQPRSSRKHEAD